MSIPESRIEAIFSDILGYEVDLEHPKSRVEELLVALGALVGNTPQLDNEGLIPISYLPPVAFADCITVADQTARYALTTDDVQNGDTVYQNDTQVMYFVVDDTKLDRADGYKALAAGIAAQAVADKNGNDITTTYQTVIDSQHKLSADLVDDSQSTNKFNMQADWSQTNSSAGDYIKNKPTLGTASALDVPVSGNASLTQVVKGDDSRLTDNRNPTDHASNKVTSMTGYTKAQADSAITTSDTLNAAIGKLEYKVDVNKTNILSEQAKTTGMTEGGSNYITVGGIRVYVSATAPTGNIPDGSVGVGWYEASEIVHRYQYGEWDGSPAPTYPVYGFKIDKNNDDPDTRVTYLYDAEGMTPAYMDFSNGTFNYGSWADAWFIKNNRPVALRFDGTVDYELNHTDFTKKLDGTTSDVEDSSYNGNFMSEMPTVYVKRWEDNDYNYMAFCEIPYNEDFLAQAHTNANGTVNSAIYLPMFKGSVDSNNKMRSLMGTYPSSHTTATNDVTYAENCGTGWQLWDKAKRDLIMDLIILITKSTNCRAKIGNGDCTTYNSSASASGKMKSGYETDSTTRSANTQFWGYEGTEVANYGKHHMMAFYIEDLWGNRFDRCLGFNLVDNVYKVKMIAPYAVDSDGSYETLTVTPPRNAACWVKNISSANTYGDVPTEPGTGSTGGFASYYNSLVSGNYLSLFGGSCNTNSQNGRFWDFSFLASSSSWSRGGSPCYNDQT